MKIKFCYISLFTLLVLLFTSCGINTDELDNKFNKYIPDEDIVAVADNSIFYFSDHTLDLRDIVHEESPNGGYMFAQNKLYFSVSRKNGTFDYSFLIYECDMNGNQRNTVFEMHEYKTHPWATVNNGIFYIEHYNKSALDTESRIIDSYNISTCIYETVSTGESYALSDYRKTTKNNYSAVKSDECLTILDAQQNEIYKIDHNILRNSEFSDALNDVVYSFDGFNVVNDHLYLIYRIHNSEPPYPYFVCEYDTETKQIIFTSFFLANDIGVICIEYLM